MRVRCESGQVDHADERPEREIPPQHVSALVRPEDRPFRGLEILVRAEELACVIAVTDALIILRPDHPHGRTCAVTAVGRVRSPVPSGTGGEDDTGDGDGDEHQHNRAGKEDERPAEGPAGDGPSRPGGGFLTGRRDRRACHGRGGETGGGIALDRRVVVPAYRGRGREGWRRPAAGEAWRCRGFRPSVQRVTDLVE